MEQHQDSKKVCSVHCTMLLSMLLETYHKLFRQKTKVEYCPGAGFLQTKRSNHEQFFSTQQI